MKNRNRTKMVVTESGEVIYQVTNTENRARKGKRHSGSGKSGGRKPNPNRPAHKDRKHRIAEKRGETDA